MLCAVGFKTRSLALLSDAVRTVCLFSCIYSITDRMRGCSSITSTYVLWPTSQRDATVELTPSPPAAVQDIIA